MSNTSNRIAGLLVSLIAIGCTGAAFAQSANGGGGRGGSDGGTGGSATTMPAVTWAVVPSNQQRPTQGRTTPDGAGCVNPTEGRQGPRLMGPCGPY